MKSKYQIASLFSQYLSRTLFWKPREVKFLCMTKDQKLGQASRGRQVRGKEFGAAALKKETLRRTFRKSCCGLRDVTLPPFPCQGLQDSCLKTYITVQGF